MSDKKINEIKELFESFGFDIKIENNNDEYCSFKIQNCFIFFIKKNDEITISFEASIRPDYAASIVTIISNNIKCRNVFVTDMFYNKDEDTYFGDQAFNEYMKEVFEDAVEIYEQQIKEYEMLQEFKPTAIN